MEHESEKKTLARLAPYVSLCFFFLVSAGAAAFQNQRINPGIFRTMFAGPQQQIFFSGLRTLVIFILFGLLFSAVGFSIRAVLHRHDAARVREYLKKSPKTAARIAHRIVSSFWLVIMNLMLVPIVISSINRSAVGRLWDERILALDRTLTGAYPFIALGNIAYPSWLFESIAFSYFQIGSALVVFAIVLLMKSKRLYHEFVAAYFISFIALILLWFSFPTISPVARFIKNDFALRTSPAVSRELHNYHPSERLKGIHRDWSITSATAFPSAHIVWLTLIGIYLFRFNRKGFLITLPFLLLSASGTVILAVHYLADVFAGILVAVLGMIIADWLAKKPLPHRLRRLP
jgi:multisubunit Na+/H+ antiporter MnhF subunit